VGYLHVDLKRQQGENVMGRYKLNFKDILLPQWESWDTGNYDLPAKSVTLIDGTKASVIVDIHGSSIYNQTLDSLIYQEDIGNCFMAKGELSHLLTEEDDSEVKIVFKKYLAYEASYVSEKE
jgi:hypothetical protein